MTALIEAYYLPPIAYFCALLNAKTILLERHERYLKQTYRNRCCINTSNGIKNLVIPISKASGNPMNDVLIDPQSPWKRTHWRTLEAAYRKAPFFDHFAPSLHILLFEEEQSLYKLNKKLLSFCLETLGISAVLTETTLYQKVYQNTEIIDLRSSISPKQGVNQQSFYSPFGYFQTFGSRFVENLSIIDLLFCEGPLSAQIVRQSVAREQRTFPSTHGSDWPFVN